MAIEDKVHIETDDGNMNFEQDGRRYRTDDHLAEVPPHVAQKLMQAGVPGVRRHSKSWAVGIDLKAMKKGE